MRMIDADALLKKKREMELCFAVTEWDIEDAPTIDPESLRPTGEWISVYDKMPKQGERVLATDGGFVGEMYINKRGQWQRYNVNDSSLMMALDILWWMPLPEPPDCGAKMKEAT